MSHGAASAEAARAGCGPQQHSRRGFVPALHGCLQQSALIGNRWVTEAGINEWADTNGLVVLYPDTIASYAPVRPTRMRASTGQP